MLFNVLCTKAIGKLNLKKTEIEDVFEEHTKRSVTKLKPEICPANMQKASLSESSLFHERFYFKNKGCLKIALFLVALLPHKIYFAIKYLLSLSLQ